MKSLYSPLFITVLKASLCKVRTSDNARGHRTGDTELDLVGFDLLRKEEIWGTAESLPPGSSHTPFLLFLRAAAGSRNYHSAYQLP